MEEEENEKIRRETGEERQQGSKNGRDKEDGSGDVERSESINPSKQQRPPQEDMRTRGKEEMESGDAVGDEIGGGWNNMVRGGKEPNSGNTLQGNGDHPERRSPNQVV